MEFDPSFKYMTCLQITGIFFFQGAYFAWKATAMGKNFVNGKTFLEKRYTFYQVWNGRLI